MVEQREDDGGEKEGELGEMGFRGLIGSVEAVEEVAGESCFTGMAGEVVLMVLLRVAVEVSSFLTLGYSVRCYEWIQVSTWKWQG